MSDSEKTATEEPQEKQQENGEQNSSKRKVAVVVIAILILVGLIFGVPAYLHARSHESTDDAFIEGHIISISPRVEGIVARVHVSDNQWVKKGELLAELDPSDFQAALDAAEATLNAAKAAHEARQLDVDVTSITTSSTLEESKASLAAAEASVEEGEALLTSAENKLDQSQAALSYAGAALDQAKADVNSAEAEHDRDVLDLERERSLVDSQTASRQDLDHAIAAERITAADLESKRQKVQTQEALIKMAGASLKSAQSDLDRAKAQLEVRRAQANVARSRVDSALAAPQRVAQSKANADISHADSKQAEAKVDQARLNLSYTKIYAPCDGFVTKKSVEPGAFVSRGQPLLAIVDPDVWVTANFKETQIGEMKPGQPVEVEVDTFPGVSFEGRVDSVQRGTGARFSLLPPENATGNFVKVVQRVPVKIVFDDPKAADYRLVPGMSVIPDVDISAPGTKIDSSIAQGAAEDR
ncbi:HlyD family secretion protein [bacterium]|nr:HlyD family secretion protein [bacterium]